MQRERFWNYSVTAAYFVSVVVATVSLIRVVAG